MSWTRIGFGAAKCTGSVENREALRLAIAGGINIVDTGTNFKDGASESMIGQELRKNERKFEVVSKFGYWKESLDVGAHKKKEPPELISVVPGVKYSLHPSFMESELRETSRRLMQPPSIYMVHNPETYVSCLITRAQKQRGKEAKQGDPDPVLLRDAREQTYEHLEKLFESLEDCFANGWIGGYGVSSHGISLPESEPLYMDWKEILLAARRGANRYRTEMSSPQKEGNFQNGGLKAFQFPGNMAELEGIKRAVYMKGEGVEKILLTRPLSVMINDQSTQKISALDYNRVPPPDYMEVCRDVISYFSFTPPTDRDPTDEEIETIQGCQFVQQLIQDMNMQLGSFKTYEHMQQELAHKIIPMIDSKFDEIDEASVTHLQKFFDCYGEMVKYNCVERIREFITAAHADKTIDLGLDNSWVDFSLKFLQNQKYVDTVLVGMHKPSYVASALAAMRNDFGKITHK